MAEPFSISAGALGVLDVGTRLSKRLRQITQTWKNAPQEMLSLQNELEDLNLVLDEIQACQQSIVAASQHDTAVATNLQGYIREARRHFEMLESSLDEMSRLKKYKKKENVYLYYSILTFRTIAPLNACKRSVLFHIRPGPAILGTVN